MGPNSNLRAVPYTTLWPGVTLWAFITSAVVAGTIWELKENYLFAYRSQPTLATIDQRFMEVSHGKHGPIYTPAFDFHFQVGTCTYHCRSTVNPDTYYNLPQGYVVPILYLTARPMDNRIERPAEIRQVQFISVIAVALSLFLTVGGAKITRFYYRRNQLNLWLLARGINCEGVVSEVAFDVVGKAQTKRYYLYFDFRDNLGRSHSGRTWYLKQRMEGQWQVGSPIQVYYDPADAERFTVVL